MGTTTTIMKVILLLSALLAAALAAPKTSNTLTCSICVDIMTDIDNFIVDTTTEQDIIDFAKELCHLLGDLLASPEIEADCNAMFENNLPAIIDGFVGDNLDPEAVCVSIEACP